jgi:hypothetical protein
MAIRRCFGNIAASDLGCTILADVSHQSVTRYELNLHGSFITACRSFHADVTENLSEPFTITTFSARGDATNSAVWQKAKLHGLEVTTAQVVYRDDVESVVTAEDYFVRARTRTQWADPQRVLDATHKGLHSMYRKQLESLGVPLWEAAPAPPGSNRESLSTTLKKMALPSSVALYFISSDGGGDQQKFRRVVKQETMYSLESIVVDQNCFQHSAALIVKGGLGRIDVFLRDWDVSFKYYASIAKIVHIWRDYCRDVYTTWLAMFGPVSANEHARRMVPKCISGRWASVHQSQKMSKSAPWIASVLKAVIEKKTPTKPPEGVLPLPEPPAPSPAVRGVDDPQLEETKQHREKIGK